MTLLDYNLIPPIIMAAIIIPWFTSIPPPVEIAWAPVIIAVPTVIIPWAIIVAPAPAAAATSTTTAAAAATTFLWVVVPGIAGIIRAWVIEALT
jgi:hypothetical protein